METISSGHSLAWTWLGDRSEFLESLTTELCHYIAIQVRQCPARPQLQQPGYHQDDATTEFQVYW